MIPTLYILLVLSTGQPLGVYQTYDACVNSMMHEFATMPGGNLKCQAYDPTGDDD